MAFVINNKITEKEAMEKIYEKPTMLHVVNVGDIKKSDRYENQYYFYGDYEFEDGTKFGASYTFYKDNNGTYKCSNSSKFESS